MFLFVFHDFRFISKYMYACGNGVIWCTMSCTCTCICTCMYIPFTLCDLPPLSDYYPNCEIVYKNLPNIHSVRKSFQQLRNLLLYDDPSK